MRMKLLVLGALLLGQTVPTSAALVAPAFEDVPSDVWYASYVSDAAAAGIVSGYSDEHGEPTGTFGPSDPVTLAQALKMAVLAAGYEPARYRDACGGSHHWYDLYECIDQAQGGEIRPPVRALDQCDACTDADIEGAWNTPATRAQAAHLIAHAFRLDVLAGTAEPVFSDHADAPEFAEIQRLALDGVVTGDQDKNGRPLGTFRPDAPVNRAEFAKLVMLARTKYGLPGRAVLIDRTEASE
jgi:hypothetical protein